MNSADKKVFFFRHGQTDWNLQSRFQGHTDIPLNQTGIEQAQELRNKLADISFDLILSSDLQRAYETAKILVSDKVPIYKSDQLRECFLGEAEGLNAEQIREEFGVQNFFDLWVSGRPEELGFHFAGGESKRSMLVRVLKYIENQLDETNASTIGISCHGGVIGRLLSYLNANNIDRLTRVENCAFYIFTYNVNTKIWLQE